MVRQEKRRRKVCRRWTVECYPEVKFEGRLLASGKDVPWHKGGCG